MAIFFFRQMFGFWYFWGIFWVLRDPTFPAKKHTKHIRKGLGSGTLNTCANFRVYLKNGVDIRTFVR